jgi:superfamily II DNA or RNA helicase
MIIGAYYRCPIKIDEEDKEYPRLFALGQLTEYNELADAGRVVFHDLLGSKSYYSEIIANDVFPAASVSRCEAVPGGIVQGVWGVGTIISRVNSGDDTLPYWYNIKLPNGKNVTAPETELRIEYSQMNYSPEKQLAAYEFQHPSWFFNRMKVSQNRHLIENAVYGFDILAGCRAFLLPHQISTVARCFESRPIRYMLADEVGLGKTVEACSILKILMSEKESFRALIIAPNALVSQWKNELFYKYSLSVSTFSLSSQVCILPLETLGDSMSATMVPWDLVIVDETHRLLKSDTLYNSILSLSRRIPHILLLSATPIQDRNEEYRRLLALLLPDQYATMSADKFSWLVKKQKRIQKVINQQIGRLDRYDEYKPIIVDELKDVAETLSDPAFSKLISRIDLESDDSGLSQVRSALAYVCENYRLERRVVRNRRQAISGKMAKRTLAEVAYTPLTNNETYNESGAIQNTLAYLSANGKSDALYVQNTAIPLLSALFSSPWAFWDMLNELKIDDSILRSTAQEWLKQAKDEHALVNAALDEDPDLIKGRLLRAVDYIEQETDVYSSPACKVVVFTGHTATLHEFMKLIAIRMQKQGLNAVAFCKGMSREALDDSVYSFQNDHNCRIIVCDETGGEGRNFQNAEQLIHLDIPWSANTLEQRIGRLDRLGREPEKDVRSTVLFAEGSTEEQLFHIWRDGLMLFNQSLSGLEIITGELNKLIIDALLDDYYNGLANAFEDILDEAEEMRESVEDEQLFDIGATLYRPLSEGIDAVLEQYAKHDDSIFAKAMLGWGGQAGLESERPTSDGLIEFRESRFSVNAAKQSLFIPPDWNKYSNASIVHREGKILGSFDRKISSVREDILFYAPGDALYDSIITNAVGCSRGRCSAIQLRSTFDFDGLVFIYDVQPAVDALMDAHINLELLSRYRMYLPLNQIYIVMPLTKESQAVEEDMVIRLLTQANQYQADHLGKRSAKHGMVAPIERFIMKNPPEKWEPLIANAAKIAYRRAAKALKDKSELKVAHQEMLRVIDGLRAECVFFERSERPADELEAELKLVLQSLKESRPELDAACFLRVRKNG